jgi:hypothetical protein
MMTGAGAKGKLNVWMGAIEIFYWYEAGCPG